MSVGRRGELNDNSLALKDLGGQLFYFHRKCMFTVSLKQWGKFPQPAPILDSYSERFQMELVRSFVINQNNHTYDNCEDVLYQYARFATDTHNVQ